MNVYQKVEEYRKQHEGMTINQACKKLKVSPWTYNNDRKKLGIVSQRTGQVEAIRGPRTKKPAKEPKPNPKDVKITRRKITLGRTAQATGTDGKLIVLMGSPDQIREVLQ